VRISLEAFPLPAANILERRRFAAFIAVSLVLHAIVIVGLPGFTRDTVVSPMPVLEVMLVTSQALPVAQSEVPAPALPHTIPAPTLQKEAAREARSEPAQSAADVPAGSFSVAPSRLPEAGPIALDPKMVAANATLTPPGFDAKYLNNPPPVYPLAARRVGEQGTVLLRVMVKRDGLPLSVDIEKSSGSRNLDVAARDAVWGWRFVPATLGTDPIESWVLVPVVFRLDGSS
jgi:periplasmic protein TonB